MAKAIAVVLALCATVALAADTMREVRQSGPCKAPFACVHIKEVAVPTVKHGQTLIRVVCECVSPAVFPC